MATAPPLSETEITDDTCSYYAAASDASGSYDSDAAAAESESEKDDVVIQLPFQTQPSQDECVICLDTIHHDCNFRSDFCSTCVYNVHTECIEDFIEYQRRMHRIKDIKCIMCSRIVDQQQPQQTAVDIINLSPDIQQASIQSIIMHQRQHRRNRHSLRRRYAILCCAIICLLLVFATIVYILSTLRSN